MRYMAGAMLVIFFLCGVALLGQAGRHLWLIGRRWPHVRRTQGRIYRIEQRRPRFHDKNHGRSRWSFFPVVTFLDEHGKSVTFTASIGEVGSESRYQAGQTLPVIYDPANVLPPLINRGLAIFLSPLLTAFCGSVFLGSAVVIWTLFGAQILGG